MHFSIRRNQDEILSSRQEHSGSNDSVCDCAALQVSQFAIKIICDKVATSTIFMSPDLRRFLTELKKMLNKIVKHVSFFRKTFRKLLCYTFFKTIS